MCSGTGWVIRIYILPKNEQGTYEGIEASEALKHMVSITQPWKCKDGRWFLPHFNLLHLEKKVLGILNCEGTPEAVSKAVSEWNSDDLDKAIYDCLVLSHREIPANPSELIYYLELACDVSYEDGIRFSAPLVPGATAGLCCRRGFSPDDAGKEGFASIVINRDHM